MQEGVRHGWTTHDFNLAVEHSLGHESNRSGLIGTLVLGVGAALVYALFERWVPGGWVRSSLVLALVIFLAWGLLFCTQVDATAERLPDGSLQVTPSDPFGVDGGAWTPVLAAGASLLAGVIIGRCYSLMREPSWWRPRERQLSETIEAITDPASLELPEERPEERRVGP
jgi:hypothetical protein